MMSILVRCGILQPRPLYTVPRIRQHHHNISFTPPRLPNKGHGIMGIGMSGLNRIYSRMHMLIFACIA